MVKNLRDIEHQYRRCSIQQMGNSGKKEIIENRKGIGE